VVGREAHAEAFANKEGRVPVRAAAAGENGRSCGFADIDGDVGEESVCWDGSGGLVGGEGGLGPGSGGRLTLV
jgi:hypothetical protein